MLNTVVTVKVCRVCYHITVTDPTDADFPAIYPEDNLCSQCLACTWMVLDQAAFERLPKSFIDALLRKALTFVQQDFYRRFGQYIPRHMWEQAIRTVRARRGR